MVGNITVDFILSLNNAEYYYHNNVFTKDSFLFVGMILFFEIVMQLHHVPVKNRSLFYLSKKKCNNSPRFNITYDKMI